MTHFKRSIATNGLVRMSIEVSEEAYRQPQYGHGAQVSLRDGWNDGCPMISARLSLDELRDLRYLIDRAIRIAPPLVTHPNE